MGVRSAFRLMGRVIGWNACDIGASAMTAAHLGDGSEEKPSGRTALPIGLGAVAARHRFEVTWMAFINMDIALRHAGGGFCSVISHTLQMPVSAGLTLPILVNVCELARTGVSNGAGVLTRTHVMLVSPLWQTESLS